ncbi:MAG: hypothetical protein V5A64_05220 [Candidatus Thermoplasmatota archaeon]
MFRRHRIYTVLFAILLILTTTLFIPEVKPCKDIIIADKGTEDNCNLLLKVRDPSRPDYQVMTITPKGYEYSYHHPWTGKKISNVVEHKFIGITSKGDTPPNIVKPGMALSDAGLAYGDADSYSKQVNPTKYGWDDFDWIRYSIQTADNEQEAVELLTNKAVDKLHAPAVSENLFVIGPKKSFLVEADAFHYTIQEVEDFVVMQNYPKQLWEKQFLRKIFISSKLDATVEKNVTVGDVIRLQGFFGVKIVKIYNDSIYVKPFPFDFTKTRSIQNLFKPTKETVIRVNESKNVGNYYQYGNFRVKLIKSNGKNAEVKMCNSYHAWEEKMSSIIEERFGEITVQDLMNWSRLKSEDLDGLRGMCQGNIKYEGSSIFKTPDKYYNFLSMGWFAANHANSSIYIPFHIADTQIYSPFKTGEAAHLSYQLMRSGGENLTSFFEKAEKVFINEVRNFEEKAVSKLENNTFDINSYLTTVDTEIQKQAYLTEEICLNLYNSSENNSKLSNLFFQVWDTNFTLSLKKMDSVLEKLKTYRDTEEICNKLEEIMASIRSLIQLR